MLFWIKFKPFWILTIIGINFYRNMSMTVNKAYGELVWLKRCYLYRLFDPFWIMILSLELLLAFYTDSIESMQRQLLIFGLRLVETPTTYRRIIVVLA